MRRILPLVLALCIGLASSLLVACGDRSGLLAPRKANAIKSQLDALNTAVANHHCDAANLALTRARNVLHSATGSSPTLTNRVAAELDRLRGYADNECQPPTAPQQTATSTQPTTTAPPTTTQPTTNTQPTTTSTTPSTDSTATSTSAPATDTSGGAPSPSNGTGNGNGNGNGNPGKGGG